MVAGFVTYSFGQESSETPAPPSDEGWKANVGLNAIFVSGNSFNQTLGANGLVSDKWDKNKVEYSASGAYGRARDNATKITATNTKNWKMQGRYDRYLIDPVSLFGLAHVGQDQPSGFDWKYGGATGLAHEIWKTDPNYFKYEAGFDYTKENRVAPPDASIYSGRLFLQYKYKISKTASLGQDLESLFNLKEGKDIRLNTLTSLIVSLTEKVALQAGYEMRFDNVPVPTFKKLDTKTQLGLVVNIL
jgi:putative salt-induced outer membrane protein